MFSSCNLNRTPLDLHTDAKKIKVNTEDSREAREEKKTATWLTEQDRWLNYNMITVNNPPDKQCGFLGVTKLFPWDKKSSADPTKTRQARQAA